MKIGLWVASFSRNATYTESEGRLFRRLHENKNDSTTACWSVVMSPGNDFFFQNKVSRWYNPEQTSYSFQSGRCTFGHGSFGLQPKIGLALNGTANLFPYRKSRFNLVKRNAIQASLRSTHSQGLSSSTRREGQRPWERGFVAWQRGSTWHVIQVLQSQNSSWSTLLDT